MTRRARTILLIPALLAGAFVAYRALAVYQWQEGACPPFEGRGEAIDRVPGPRTLRVLSYNIEGHATLLDGDHIAEIAKVIREARPDVVGLQEVHTGTWQARGQDQAGELARLTGMTVAFGPSFHSLGGAFGNAVLARGAIVNTRVYPLPGIGEPRALLQATAVIDGRPVNVFVAHLAAWGRWNRKQRLTQAQCVESIAAKSAIPFVVVGDFNAIASAPEMSRLVGSRVMRPIGNLEEPTHKMTKVRLDFIFADPAWSAVSSAVLEGGPSDHRPLIAELRRDNGSR